MKAIGWQSAENVSHLRRLGFCGFVFPGLTPWAKFFRASGVGEMVERWIGVRAGRASSAPTKRRKEGWLERPALHLGMKSGPPRKAGPTLGAGRLREEDLGFGFDYEEGVGGGVAGVAELLEGFVESWGLDGEDYLAVVAADEVEAALLLDEF
jgi:hypothetical protein